MNSDKSVKKGILSGTGSGIVTTLCCVGPLIIILLGFGTFTLALSVSQYRPYFIALGILFLILSILLHLRKKNCCHIEGLKRERLFIISAVLSMGIVYLGALYVIVPAISPLVYEDSRDSNPVSGDASPEISNKLQNQETYETETYESYENASEPVKHSDEGGEDTSLSLQHKLILKIGGMTCQNCADIIEGGLRELDGVVDVEVSYPEEIGEVIYDPGKITKEQIVESDVFSAETGYTAEIISDEQVEIKS